MMRSKRYVALLSGLAAAGICVAAWFLLAGPGGSSEPAAVVSTDSLEGVTKEQLATEGIELVALDVGAQPNISREAAERIALGEGLGGSGASVLEAVFARFVMSQHYPPMDRPAWVISLSPEDVPTAGPLGGTNEYALVIVDAETGEHILSTVATRPPEGGGLPSPYRIQ